MSLIKKLFNKNIRTCRSSISEEQIKKFKYDAQITNPANYSKKIMPKLTTDEVVNLGIEHMKKDGFKIATEEVVKGL